MCVLLCFLNSSLFSFCFRLCFYKKLLFFKVARYTFNQNRLSVQLIPYVVFKKQTLSEEKPLEIVARHFDFRDSIYLDQLFPEKENCLYVQLKKILM